MVKGKRGWIKIIEAYLAIMLFMGLVFIIIQSQTFDKKTTSIFEEDQFTIMKKIQSNETLRNEILNISILPQNNDMTSFPVITKNYFENEIGQKNCSLNVCEVNEPCFFYEDVKNEVYSKDFIIFSNSTYYSPRKVNIVCYPRG
jgi:hypothetical protein